METSFHSTLLANHQEEEDMLSYFIPTQSIPLYPCPFYLFVSSFLLLNHTPPSICLVLFFSSGIQSCPSTNCVFINYYKATANSNSLFINIFLLYIFVWIDALKGKRPMPKDQIILAQWEIQHWLCGAGEAKVNKKN